MHFCSSPHVSIFPVVLNYLRGVLLLPTLYFRTLFPREAAGFCCFTPSFLSRLGS